MKEKTKAFYKAVFKYWLNERKKGIKRLLRQQEREVKRNEGNSDIHNHDRR